MKKILVFLILLTCFSTVWATYYDADYYRNHLSRVGSGDVYLDSLYLFMGNPAVTTLKVIEGGATPTYYTTFTGGDQAANLTLTLPTAYAGSTGYVLTSTDAGVLSWAASAGSFTGGSVTGDIVMANGIYLQSSETTAQASAIQVWDTTATASYTNVLSWVNGAVPDIVLGAATNTLALVSTGLNVSTAGVVTGAAGITNTGTLANTGAITQTGGIASLNASSNYAVNVGTGTNNAAVAIGGGYGTLVIDTTSWDMSSGGVGTGFGSITFMTGSALKTSTTTAETLKIQAYDTDPTPGYEDSMTFTNGAVPAITIGTGTDTLAINTTTWDCTSAGVMSGLTGLTVAGTTSINDSASTATTSIGGGTTTGAVSIGTGASAQTVNVGTGGGAKATTIGSTNTTSGTTIQSGSGDISITSTDDFTATASGAVALFSNAVEQTITLGNETSASSLAFKAGTGNITMDGVAATTITIGDAAQTGTMKFGESSAACEVDLATGNGAKTVNLGVGTGINAINVGTGGTGAKTIIVGDGASTGTTTVTAGSGGVSLPAAATTIGDAIGDITTFTGKIAGATPMSFDGATANTAYTILAVADVAASVTVTCPNSTSALMGSTLTTNNVNVVNSVWGGTNQIILEGATADAYETIITPTDPTADRTITLPDATGTVLLTGRTGQIFTQSVADAKLGSTGEGWVIDAADDLLLATLPQSLTTEKLIIPVTVPLKVGSIITGFGLNGQIESAGGNVVVTATMNKMTAAAGDYTTAAIGAITVATKTADYKIVDVNETITADTVAADETFFVIVIGTTAATTDIAIGGITVTVTEP